MATIYFGADAPIIAENGNWNDVNQWYSDPGNGESKSYVPGTLLGRLPLLTDICILCQFVTSGVVARVLTLTGVSNGIWTGAIGPHYTGAPNLGLNDPAATWTTYNGGTQLSVLSGTVNFSFSNANTISGGTINGNVTNISNLSGGTFNGNVSGELNLYGNPVFNGALTNITILRLYTGATLTKAITSWSSGSISILGGTFNPASVATAGLTSGFMNTGTMGFNIFTSAYTNLGGFNIVGGTLSFAGDIQVGAPGRVGSLSINSSQNSSGPQFTGTSKNITVYGNSSGVSSFNFGSSSPVVDAGTYTGVITLLPATGTNAALFTVRGGTYTPPVQILPLTNVAYGTGKGINASVIYKNYGFATFNQQLSVSGSSDILQSELA